MRTAAEQALLDAYSTPADPGLRERYASLTRAPIRLIVSPMGKAVNQGGLLRIAESFRLERVEFEGEADGFTDFSGCMSTDRWQPFRWTSVTEAIGEAKESGYEVVGLSLGETAEPLGSFDWNFPCALVLGQERSGLAPEHLALCDRQVAIPLYGLVNSLNVAAATAICVHAAVSAYVGLNPDFEPAREVSRRLLGLEPRSSQDPETTDSA